MIFEVKSVILSKENPIFFTKKNDRLNQSSLYLSIKFLVNPYKSILQHHLYPSWSFVEGT